MTRPTAHSFRSAIGAAALFVFLYALLPGCALLKQLTDPVTGVLKRGSCISIDVPPITLTPERTAAERQLIGENRELERNGWLLASAQNARRYERSGGTGSGDTLPEIRRLYREQAVLEFYQRYLRLYRSRGLLGESRKGHLAVLPGRLAPRATRSERARARLAATEVNRSRTWIYRYRLKQEKKKKLPNLASVRRRYLLIYWEQAPAGSWVENVKGGWTRRR